MQLSFRFLLALLLVGGLLRPVPGAAQASEDEEGDELAEEDGEFEEDEELDEDEGEDDELDEEDEELDEEEEPEEPEEPVGEPYEPTAQAPRTPRTLCHGRRIRQIQVEGVRLVDPDDVRATMRLRRGLPCTDEEIARDARALWEMGYFDDLAIEADADGNEVDITVRLRERPAIARIVFDGNDEVEKDDIDEKVNLREGAILSIPDVRAQITKIRDLYAEEGYFLARVDYEIRRLENRPDEVEVRYVIDEGPEVTVRRIRFVGNRAIPSDELHDIMQTSEHGFFSFISDNDHYNRETFEQDHTRLQAWYYDKGYLTVRIGAPRIELTPDRQHIDITIPITEGPRFRIGRLSVREVDDEGNEVEALRDDLRDEIDVDTGDWFSSTKVRLGIDGISRIYRDEGYARVDLTPDMDVQQDQHVVNLQLNLVRGPPVRIERINIRGNTKTRDRVIRREFLVNEGDLYNQTLIERSRGRIQALGYFERVDLSEETGSARDRIVINVQVGERSTGTFQVGAGFSSIEQFILTAQVQQQNLFGNGHLLSLQLQLSGIRQFVQLRFVEPWFLGTQWSLGVDAFKTIRQFAGFNRDSTGGGITLGHPIVDRRLRFSVGYQIENVNISARTGGIFQSGGGGQGFNLFQRLPFDGLYRDGITSSIRLSLTWDGRNNRLFPTAGWFVNYTAEVAERFLGSDQIFVRHTGFARFYRQIFEMGEGRPVTFKANAQFGLITGRNGVPIYERFRLGGIFDVRGYPLQSLGPRAAVGRALDPNAIPPLAGRGVPGGVVLGGNLQLFYQAELEFTLLPEVGIRGVLFTDGGNVWNLERKLCQAPVGSNVDVSIDNCGFNPNIRTSWGFGFRWFSPLGPLRFEWGIPIRRRSYERRIDFQFTIGNSF